MRKWKRDPQQFGETSLPCSALHRGEDEANMDVERIIFDPDGDIVLLLQSHTTDDTEKGSTIPTIDSASSEPPVPEAQKKFEMLVSSRHLMLASPVFKAMLKGNFREGQALKSLGKVEVPLPDDDPNTLTILLNIVHGLFSRVPDKVDVPILRGLSILVDKYQMKQTASLYVDKIWMPGLVSSLPKSYSADLFLWLDISWVFAMSAEFTHVTKILLGRSPGPIAIPPGDISLVPTKIFEDMSSQRETTIWILLTNVQYLIDASMTSQPVSRPSWPGYDPETSCVCTATTSLPDGYKYATVQSSFACNGMMLGTLLKSATATRLYPPPVSPYMGFSVISLIESLRRLEIVSICDIQRRKDNRPPSDQDAHGQKKYLKDQAIRYMSELQGLSLHTYA